MTDQTKLTFNDAYCSTSLVYTTAGIKDKDDDYKIEDVNRIIKAVMLLINKEINETSNLTMPVPEDLQLATAYLCSCVIKSQHKELDLNTVDRTWREHLEIGMMFLKSYLKNPVAFQKKFGYMVQSGYLTRPASPDVEPYRTTFP